MKDFLIDYIEELKERKDQLSESRGYWVEMNKKSLSGDSMISYGVKTKEVDHSLIMIKNIIGRLEKIVAKENQRDLIAKTMESDEKDGLYNE